MFYILEQMSRNCSDVGLDKKWSKNLLTIWNTSDNCTVPRWTTSHSVFNQWLGNHLLADSMFMQEFDNNKTKLSLFLKYGAIVPCSTCTKKEQASLIELSALSVRIRIHVITLMHMNSPFPALIDSMEYFCNF